MLDGPPGALEAGLKLWMVSEVIAVFPWDLYEQCGRENSRDSRLPVNAHCDSLQDSGVHGPNGPFECLSHRVQGSHVRASLNPEGALSPKH